MSASLVGSEMCIRDSVPAIMPAIAPAIVLAVVPVMAQARTSSRGLPGPVSYTHLTLPTICSV
eukprot:10210785-Alexandrium_andersonii.AAC.1